jgi:hypothetical protein
MLNCRRVAPGQTRYSDAAVSLGFLKEAALDEEKEEWPSADGAAGNP